MYKRQVYEQAKKEFADRGCYLLNPEETEKVRKTILINGALNAKIVGQSAHTIANLAGVKTPEDAKILIGQVESVELEEEFAHEKLSPVLAMYLSLIHISTVKSHVAGKTEEEHQSGNRENL